VTLLTAEHGKLSAMAKGAMRKKSPFAGVLEPFALCECVLYIKKTREVQTLSACALLEFYGRVREEGRLIAAAQAALELIRRTVHEGEPVPRVFELLRAYLRQLDEYAGASATQVEKLIWRFMLHYLKVMGFAPVLNACVRCGSAGARARVMVSPLAGGMLCERCGMGVRDGRFAPAAALREMDALFRGSREEAERKTLSHRELVGELVFDFLRAHFEQDMRLNSLDVFYKL
jgi:DNA repair protein RecO (recombination protein O)